MKTRKIMSECKYTYITLHLYIYEYIHYSKYWHFTAISYTALFTHFNMQLGSGGET
jgi:hypothetical protein